MTAKPTYSLDAYRRLLTSARELGYEFAPFPVGRPEPKGRIYLRHDIDFSLGMARELAEVNRELGIRATFFLLVRSQIYNALSRWAMDDVRAISQSGQGVALHAAVPPGNPGVAALADYVNADHAFLKASLPFLEPVVAWHMPTPEILDQTREHPFLGSLVNAYGRPLVGDIRYLSDSSMRHTPAQILSALEEQDGGSVQLLLHPFIWIAGGNDMADVFATTWRRIMAEREMELSAGRAYSSMMPGGTPDAILSPYLDAWRRAAKGRIA